MCRGSKQTALCNKGYIFIQGKLSKLVSAVPLIILGKCFDEVLARVMPGLDVELC
jgi:hypothetical protein